MGPVDSSVASWQKSSKKNVRLPSARKRKQLTVWLSSISFWLCRGFKMSFLDGILNSMTKTHAQRAPLTLREKGIKLFFNYF